MLRTSYAVPRHVLITAHEACLSVTVFSVSCGLRFSRCTEHFDERHTTPTTTTTVRPSKVDVRGRRYYPRRVWSSYSLESLYSHTFAVLVDKTGQ